MVRVYDRYKDQWDRDEARWVASIIQEAQAEQAKRPMTAEEILVESERLVRSAAKRAKVLGIKTDLNSATRIIHKRRKARRSS